MIGGLILAAGGASRFGAPKQLAELDGRPLLEHSIETMCAVAALDPVVVVLGAAAGAVQARVRFGRARPLRCAGWAEGQAAGLRAGVAELAGVDAGAGVEAVVVVLGDQPGIDRRAIERVLAAREGVDAVRATYDGQPGHPVLLGRSLFGAIEDLRGDEGARGLFAPAAVREVGCDGVGAADDVDTPDELEALRR